MSPGQTIQCYIYCFYTLMLKKIYQVYVIELSKRVFSESVKFRTANPQYNGVLECLYVGMTSKMPKERFEQHKSGYRNKSLACVKILIKSLHTKLNMYG